MTLDRLNSYKICVTTKHIQKRTSKNKLLNTIYKWIFGFQTIEMQEDGKAYFVGDTVYMTENDFEHLKKELGEIKWI